MKLFTIGYGGRTKDEFLTLARQRRADGGRCAAASRPASMGIWVKAKTPDKGIEKMLSDAGIGYRSLVELGNLFLDFDDWQQRYGQLLESPGELLVGRLAGLAEPMCLLSPEAGGRLPSAVDCRVLGSDPRGAGSTPGVNGQWTTTPCSQSAEQRTAESWRRQPATFRRQGSRPFRAASRRLRGCR